MAKQGRSEPLSKPTPTLAIEHVRIGDLRPADYNPRMMSGEARKRLKRSVAEFGMVDPIIARRSDNLVVGGHQRLTAALDLGLETVPVVYLDDLDDKRAAALNVALNNRNIAGEYDLPKLAELLTTLDVDGFDATLTGFDEAEIARLLAPVSGGLLPGVDPDSVPDAPKVPTTVLGDVITLGAHRLVCGDSTDATAWTALLGEERADLIWTDPPYGVSYGEKNAMLNRYDGGHGSKAGWSRLSTPIENDSMSPAKLREFLRAVLSLAWANCREGGSWYVAAPAGPPHFEFAAVLYELEVWRHTLNWVKDGFVFGRSDYHYRHEPIFYGWKEGAAHTWNGGRSQDSCLEIPRPRASKLHPTMKPVALIRRCVENSSDEKAVVCDPFGGSGSTLIACEETNRRARLIELSPAYCDVIVTRWEQATGKVAERHVRT